MKKHISCDKTATLVFIPRVGHSQVCQLFKLDFRVVFMGVLAVIFGITIWVFPKIVGKPPKWMVYNGKPY